MSAERNEILTVAVPELRNLCIGKGLEFEICDMRWGVRDDASISHSTSDICLKELRTCQQISQGPNFVAILGNKYGYCPYPSRLGVEEFTTLDSLIRSQDSKDADLINRWFRKDTNATPSMYILQPITDILQFYGDMNPDNKELFEREQEEWRRIDSELSRILRYASLMAFDQGLMSEANKHSFHRSITEHEIDEGVFRADKKDRVLCFTRDISDINSTDEIAGKYIDLTADGELKKTSIDLLEKLKTERLSACLDEGQIERYSVGWTPSGVTPDNQQHQAYLVTFREAFISKLTELIIASQSDRNKTGADGKVYQEALHHLTFCQKKCENFQGRGELITRVQMTFGQVFEDKQESKEGKDNEDEEESEEEFSEEKRLGETHKEYASMADRYRELGIGYSMEDYNVLSDPNKDEKLECLSVTQNSSYTKALVIHGESGCGKTALMAKIAQVISMWSPRSAWLVRFLGTSPQSSAIRDTLVSICYQIYKIYDLEPPRFDIKDDFPFLVQYFNALLWKIDSKSKPLYILLDSLDQLNNSDHAFSLSWLPTKLPENVHIVLSTLPEMYDILTNLKSRLTDDNLFFEVDPLPVSDASDLLFKVWSRTVNREFTQPQRQLLKSKISSGAVPLYLKLLFYQAVKWHSYTDVTDVQLALTAQAAINQLFDDLEILHGKTLITKAFGYMTAAKSGLSNQEMEHLLSLDDEVLQDVYLYHLPPNENSIILPSLIWRRVVYDLGEYLVDRRADGRTVKTWYHRQFHVVAEERYLKGSQKVKVHAAMVEYFMGIWSNRAKPLELYKLKTGRYPNALRQVPEQPILLTPSVFNLRKLTELPHHLINSNQFDEFRALVACNIEWLYSKCKAVGLSEILQDLQLAISEGSKLIDTTSSSPSKENDNMADILSDVKFVSEMLVIGSDNIRKSSINLPIQVVGQLGSTSQKSIYLEKLVDQSQEFCNQHPHSILIPQHPCLPSPGGNVKLSINVGVQSPGAFPNSCTNRSCLAIRDERYLLVAEMGGNLRDCDKLKSFDLEDGQCVFTAELKNRTVNISLVDENRYVQVVWTADRDQYNPTCYQRLLLTSSLTPVNLPDHVTQLTFSPSGKLLAYSLDCDIFVKPAKSLLTEGKSSKEFKITLPAPVCHIIVSPDDKYMVTTTTKKMQMVWSLESKNMLHTLGNTEKEFMSLEFQLSCALIMKNNWFICPGLMYSDEGTVYVTDIETGELVYKFEGSSKYESHFVRLHPSGTCVLFGNKSSTSSSNSGDKIASLWSLKTGKQISECSAVEGPYSDLQIFGTDHIFIASSHLYKEAVIHLHWAGTESNPQYSAVLVRVLVAHNDSIIQILVTPDKLISASKDNTVKVWDLAEIQRDLLPALESCDNPEDVRFLPSLSEGKLPVPGRDPIKTTAMVVCRKRAVVGSKDGFLIFYDLDTSEQLSYLRLCETNVVTMVTTTDEEHIVVATRKTIFVIKAEEDQVEREISVPQTVDCLAVVNNVIVAGHAGMEAYGYAWNLHTGKELGKFQGLYGFHCIAINSEGTRLGGSFFEYPALYALDTGDILTSLDGADVMMSGQTFVLFSPDDRYLVGGSTDGSIRVMDGHTGKYLHRFQQLSSSIAACFSPDSKILVTSGWRTMYLWSVEKGTLLRSVTRHEDFVVKLKFSSDGRFLVSCSKDKQIIVWNWSGLYSVAVYMAHCPIDVMDIARDLSSVIYAPDSVHYVSILKPNKQLLQIIGGQLRSGVPSELQDAQAMALSFSSQGLRRETTQACVLL